MVIDIKNIHKSFKKNHVLKGITLSLNSGGIWAVLGPNASGKTTLIKTILGMVLHEEGQIYINGENIHFSSVLVMHPASRTIHVDDTLMYIRLPILMRWFGLTDAMSFHPTLAKVLEKRPGAANDFSQWAEELAENWRDAENLCAAHTATLLASDNHGSSIHDRIIRALEKVHSTLSAHERKFG